MNIYLSVLVWWLAFPVAAVAVGCAAVEAYRWARLRWLWRDRRPGYLPITQADWNRQYDEAMRWRDWQTCDYLIEEREQLPWYSKIGAAVASRRVGPEGQTTASSGTDDLDAA